MKPKIQDSSVFKNRVSALLKIQNWSRWKYLGVYALLGAIAIIMLFPLLWLISTALKSPNEDIFKFPPQLLPSQPTLQNFVEVWQTNPFGQYLFNSTLIAVLTVGLNLLLCALAAYPLPSLLSAVIDVLLRANGAELFRS